MLTRNPRITEAGLALFTNQAPGFSVSVTHIALGSTNYDPTGTETALQSEFARFPIATGADISPSQIQIGALITNADPAARSTNNKWIGEIGFYVGATLLAVLSQSDRALFYKSPDLDVPISYILDFSTLPPGSLTVGAPGLSGNIQLAAQTAQAEAASARNAASTAKSMKEAVTADLSGYVSDYDALRLYNGPAERIYVTGIGALGLSSIAGEFVLDKTDTVSADTAGTIIVGARGRWKRVVRGSAPLEAFGVKTDGSASIATALALALGASQVVKVGAGKFLYDAAVTADPARIEFEKGADFVGMTNRTTSITIRDRNGKVIGFQYNYNEETDPSKKITTGWLLPPPISQAVPYPEVDMLGHFYNDFGLEATRAANGVLGSVTWWSWFWNHVMNTASGPYDPSRHPYLGWYRGDDPVVLDRICYDLREAGLAGVILQTNAIDTSVWADNKQKSHWLYQLFTNTPNFKGLKYVMSGPATGTQAAFEAHWNDVKANVLSVHRNFHVTRINGKRLPTIYLHDMGTLRTGVYANNANFETWMKSMATFFQGLGYDGVCILGRLGAQYTSSANTKATAQLLNDFGVYVFETDYGVFPGVYAPEVVYSDYVNQYDASYAAVKQNRIPNVCTSRLSKNHPSNWTITGSTPDLFGKVLRRAVSAAVTNQTIPNIVTIYNVSEWAEGGPGLIANMRDGFGYLDAVRSVGTSHPVNKNLTPLFDGTSAVKTGNANDSVAFTPFTYKVTTPHSATLVELMLVAKENTGNYTDIAAKYVFTLHNASGVLTSTVPLADYSFTRNNANYTITAAATVNIVDASTATVSITLTKGGAIGWSTCEYAVRTTVLSTDPASVS